MLHPLLDHDHIDAEPETYLRSIGTAFAVFDEHTQTSGNVSYGVRIGFERYFVKTAGRPHDPRPVLKHPERVARLRNAVRVWRSCPHPALPRLHRVIESPEGPLLVYQWVDGELLGVPRAHRDDPASPFQRFRRLPAPAILGRLDTLFELHAALARCGWVAVDFYDGCLIYDFRSNRLSVVDLDMYHQGPFRNTMGRMFGSTRFMAPEEFELGAPIDERTNVFTMGRTALVFLSDGTLDPHAFRGTPPVYEVVARACQPDRSLRYESMAAFWEAWREARGASRAPWA